ncbi:SCO6880 family protein [Occultella aeris]|uniref:PrgI family protein n=1 Tax=Occultella aeris TaxID=2761496 RepID=A0A7M4DKS2_9MICO|nr:SCO6880 family protein [Occultella aeris]VZO37764.1 hypothetical protein HALOF300_02736 [Occultella aeris]
MSGASVNADGVPSALLAPVRRSGVALGLSGGQLAITATAVTVALVANVAGGWSTVARVWWVWLPLLALGVGSWHGRSFLERIAVEALFGARAGLGKTAAAVDVATYRTESRVEIPGAIGHRMHLLELVGTSFPGACMVWDAALGTATAVLRMPTRAWHLTSPAEQATRCAALGRACRSLSTLTGVIRVVTYARTIPRTLDHLRPEQDRSLSDFATVEYGQLLDGAALGAAPYRDILVAITLDKAAVAAEVKRAGGGRAGVSRVLADRVKDFAADLPGCGVDLSGSAWMSGAAIRAACRLAFDPVAASWLDPREGISADYLVVTSPVEHRDHLEVDSALARTWWVERWPSEPVRGGFLARLIATGGFWHTVTQVWEPADVRASQKRLDNDQSAMDTMERVNRALKRDASAAQVAEQRALETRRADLVEGYGDVRYSVYVTGIAGDADGLEAIGRWLRQAAPDTGMNPLPAQQWAAFAQAALPLGIPTRGGRQGLRR